MPYYTSTIEEFKSELANTEPIPIPDFDRLYIAIARAINKDFEINYSEPGMPGTTWRSSGPLPTDIVNNHSRVGANDSGVEYALQVYAEGCHQMQECGLVARARMHPITPGPGTLCLIANESVRHIVDSKTGDSITTSVFDQLLAEVVLL